MLAVSTRPALPRFDGAGCGERARKRDERDEEATGNMMASSEVMSFLLMCMALAAVYAAACWIGHLF
jgi:hypothetical protein